MRYADELGRDVIHFGPGKVLHFLWVGASAMEQMWLSACGVQPDLDSKLSVSEDEPNSQLSRVLDAVMEQVLAVQDEITEMRKNSAINK